MWVEHAGDGRVLRHLLLLRPLQRFLSLGQVQTGQILAHNLLAGEKMEKHEGQAGTGPSPGRAAAADRSQQQPPQPTTTTATQITPLLLPPLRPQTHLALHQKVADVFLELLGILVVRKESLHNHAHLRTAAGAT